MPYDRNIGFEDSVKPIPYRILRYACYAFAVALAIVVVRLWTIQYEVKPTLRKIAAHKLDGGFFAVNTLDLNGASSYDKSKKSIIAYGDSANDSFHPTDPDPERKFITTYLQDAVRQRDIRVYATTRDGFGPEVYSSHFRFATTKYPGIDYAVFPINFEWLSPMRRMNTERFNYPRLSWEYVGLKFPWLPVQVDFVFQPPATGYKWKRDRAETALGDIEWKDISPLKVKTQRAYPGLNPRFNGDEKRYWDNAFQLAFAQRLTEEDPLLKLLLAIQEHCDESRVKCLFSLTPLNIKYMERNAHLHPTLEFLKENVELFEQFSRDHKLALLNLIDDAETYQFNDYCSSHVSYPVRRYISFCVGEALDKDIKEVDCPSTRAKIYPFPRI